jgi:hypothetical protein
MITITILNIYKKITNLMQTLTELIVEKKKRINHWDIILGYAILNSELLDFTTQPRNKYFFSDQNFLTLLKHSNMMLAPKISWKVKNPIDEIKINVEKNWNKLVQIKNKADNIRSSYDSIDKITFSDDEMKINSDSLSNQNKKYHSKTYLMQNFFGLNNSEIYRNEDMWDLLIRHWMKLVFIHATQDATLLIENFIFDNRVQDLTFDEYKDITVSEEYKYLGVYVPKYNKNFKKLVDLMKFLSKDETAWKDYPQMMEKWHKIKNEILNKQILLPLIKSKYEHDTIKNNVLNIIADHIDSKKNEYTNIKNLDKIPSRNNILKNDIDISVGYWNDKDYNFVYILKCNNKKGEIGVLRIEIKWQSPAPSKDLQIKMKIDNLNLQNLINE